MADNQVPRYEHKPDMVSHGKTNISIGNLGDQLDRSPFAGYKSLAVAGGTGGLGALITEELVKVKGAKVYALSRKGDASLPEGAHLRTVDYDDVEQLTEVLKGVEVLISTLSGAALDGAQHNLAKAAKRAKVLLFVPSEFGLPTHDLPKDSPLWVKANFQNTLKSMQLDYCVLYNYIFSDYIYQPAFGFDFLGGFVELVGTGDVQIPQTSRRDVARFLAYILTELPPALIINKRLTIEANRCSFNEAIDIYRDTHPDGKIFVQRISLEESEAKLAHNPTDLAMYLRVELAKLEAPTKDQLSNKLWPDWNPKSVREVIYAME